MSKGNQGIRSKNVTRPGVRTGAGAKAINHAGAAQIGVRVGDHVTNQGATGYGGVGVYSNGPGYNKAPYGNEVAKNTVCGVGGSRTVYARGTQGVQGSAAPGNPPPAKALWPGWEKR